MRRIDLLGLVFALAVGLLVVLAAPAVALADDAGGDETVEVKPLAESLTGMARAEYAAARVLYEDGDFSGALVKLESAYKMSEDPRLLWNMAAAHKNLRNYARVLALLDRYLSEGGNLVSEDDRANAQQLIETVRAFVTDLVVEAKPDGAQILVDGEQVGTTPMAAPVRVDMGVHELSVTKDGYVSNQRRLDLPGGQRFSVELSLDPVKHEGTLRIVTDAKGVIRVNGKVVGTGLYNQVLPSGSYVVGVTADGKEPHEAEVLVRDDDTTTLHVNLKDVRTATTPVLAPNDSSSSWWWVAGGAVLAGAGVGAYYLFRPDDERPAPETGTWGAFEL